MDPVTVRALDDQTAELRWTGQVDPDALQQLLADTAARVLAEGRFRRLELTLAASDRAGRRAALRAGFRLEGVRRQALRRPGADPGNAEDAVILARLVSDQVDGPTAFSAVMNSALPRKRLIAHVLMRDEAGRILFCDTRFKSDWELPGGIVEPFETPRDAAVREVREELGIDLEPGPLLAVDWMPPYLGWDDALELIFDGGRVTEAELDSFVLQPSEIISVMLRTVDEAEDHLIPLSARRLRAITALRPGETVLLEDGSPIA